MTDEPINRTPSDDPAEVLRSMLLNRRGLFDATVPPLLFVTVNTFWGLAIAAAVAAALGVGIALYRLVRRHETKQAVVGLVGLAIALLIALRTGRATGYFLPGVVTGVVTGVVLLGSIVVGRPLSAFVARAVEGKPIEYYRERAVRNSHAVVTFAWALVTFGRVAYKAMLIAQDRATAAGVASVVTGWPVTALLVFGSVAFLRWRGHAGRAVPEPAE